MTAERPYGIVRGAMCDHLHDTTSRYDAARKLLTFLLFCPACGTEKIVETLGYEPQPRFGPDNAAGTPRSQLARR